MNIYWREIRSGFKSLCFWCIGLLVLLAIGMVISSVLSNISPSLYDQISNMPPLLQGMIGGSELHLSQTSGYYGLLFHFLLFAASIYAVLLGSGIIGKEERQQTAEFLLCKPISRMEVIWAKLLAAITQLLCYGVVAWAGSTLLLCLVVDGRSMIQANTVLMIGMLLVQLVFMSLGMALSAVCKGAKWSTTIAVAILLAAYCIAVVMNMSMSVEVMNLITPFKYINTFDILTGGGLDLRYAVTSIVLFVLFSLITFAGYRRRDLRV